MMNTMIKVVGVIGTAVGAGAMWLYENKAKEKLENKVRTLEDEVMNRDNEIETMTNDLVEANAKFDELMEKFDNVSNRVDEATYNKGFAAGKSESQKATDDIQKKYVALQEKYAGLMKEFDTYKNLQRDAVISVNKERDEAVAHIKTLKEKIEELENGMDSVEVEVVHPIIEVEELVFDINGYDDGWVDCRKEGVDITPEITRFEAIEMENGNYTITIPKNSDIHFMLRSSFAQQLTPHFINLLETELFDDLLHDMDIVMEIARLEGNVFKVKKLYVNNFAFPFFQIITEDKNGTSMTNFLRVDDQWADYEEENEYLEVFNLLTDQSIGKNNDEDDEDDEEEEENGTNNSTEGLHDETVEKTHPEVSNASLVDQSTDDLINEIIHEDDPETDDDEDEEEDEEDREFEAAKKFMINRVKYMAHAIEKFEMNLDIYEMIDPEAAAKIRQEFLNIYHDGTHDAHLSKNRGQYNRRISVLMSELNSHKEEIRKKAMEVSVDANGYPVN